MISKMTKLYETSSFKDNTSNTKKRYIGTSFNNYNTKRNITGLCHSYYDYRRERDVFSVLSPLARKITGNYLEFLQSSHFSINGNSDLYHHFNCVSFSKKPWITTFEFTLPRWYGLPTRLYKTGVELLASQHCRQLIAISQHAKLVQSQWLKEFFPNFHDPIMEKVSVILPPQSLGCHKVAIKSRKRRPLIFTFIGNDFFRKGGREILRVFNRLELENKDYEYILNIVSSLKIGDYATRTDTQIRFDAIHLIKGNPKIRWFQLMSNDEVMKLLGETHVALLPSFADTFGYSVLEAQSMGCAVITTNVQALPEVNSSDTGWVIDLPLNAYGEAAMDSVQSRQSTSEVLESGLFKVIKNILIESSFENILVKQENSLDRIEKLHNPQKIASQISAIYDMALSTQQ
jgi:glycosyltransferase involved in cell wall biosynthesis